ncbi:MAG: PolC-type DNA polymerase III [Blautia massiliensis (ex Durand et al. 2017)]
MFEESYVVYDIETSGLSPKRDVITQISALRVVDGRKDDTLFNVFVKSEGVYISDEVSRLTGITDEVLDQYGISINAAMDQFRAYIGTNRLIAHNGKRFDSKFLQQASEFTGISLCNEQEDSLQIAKEVLPGLKSYSLGALVEYFDVYQREAHRAQNDVLMLADVVERLFDLRRQRMEKMQMKF